MLRDKPPLYIPCHLAMTVLLNCLFFLAISILNLSNAENEYGVDTFRDVRETKTFVDKTLLIQNIFNYTYMLVTAPRYFGKSVNIDMIKVFLGNKENINECQRIFKDTKVMANEQFVREHMNKHPILYCNFDIKFEVICFESLLSYYRQVIYGIFIEHDYLHQSTVLSNEQKREYAKYVEENDELEEEKLAEALRFLSQLLYLHNKKSVILLIDEYDAVVVDNLLIRGGYNDTAVISRFQENILNRLLLDNEHIERAILSGTLPVQFANVDFKQIRFTEDEEFLKYYGFTDDEVHILVEEFKLSKDERIDLQKWYDGYYSLRNGSCIFSPLAVLKFLQNKRPYGYWVHYFPLKDIVLSLMDIEQFQEIIVSLVQGAQPVVIGMKKMLTTNDLVVLSNGVNKKCGNNLHDTDVFFQFLLELGYLTYGEPKRPLPESSVVVKVPNREIREELSTTIKKYFSQMRES